MCIFNHWEWFMSDENKYFITFAPELNIIWGWDYCLPNNKNLKLFVLLPSNKCGIKFFFSAVFPKLKKLSVKETSPWITVFVKLVIDLIQAYRWLGKWLNSGILVIREMALKLIVDLTGCQIINWRQYIVILYLLKQEDSKCI